MGSRVSANGPQRLSLQRVKLEGMRGRWVALDECRYDKRTSEVVEGIIVDSDEDLVELCTRIRRAELQHCAIVFCSEDEAAPVPPQSRSRLAH